MSFILDALRKSEARRQTGQSPRINDGPEPGPPKRPRWPRWLSGVLVVAILAAAVTAGVWFVGPKFQDGHDRLADSPPADEVPRTPVEPVDTRESAAETAAAPSAAEPEPQPIEQESEGSPEAERQSDEAEPDRRRIRRAAPERSTTRQAPPRERVVTDPDEALAEIEREIEQEQARQEAQSAQASSPEPAQAETPQGDDEPWRPDAQEYVRIWELPLSIRRNLPELQLTIHVFSPEQGTRFVLINGERYVPGDQLTADTRLVDIRREGAIVDFREHRFLLEP